MDDAGLDAIRQKRMAEMQAQGGGGAGGGGAGEQAEKQARQQEMKNNLLTAILDQKARARLNTIAQVKPERAQKVEMMLINMHQRRQIMGQVGEAELIKMLEEISKTEPKGSKVNFDRRRVTLDSDSD
ncbi:programmed cell death protein 5-like [Bolinopsis microptera]|uniref:programmed cell death protein 5-like n=1 Tax=Bolinopsis microptera TaxID=2820187 RepID=UPI00307AC534